MAFDLRLPGQRKPHNAVPFEPDTKKQRAGLGSAATKTDDIENLGQKADQEKIIRFDNMDEVENAFKRGSLNWPNSIEVHGFKYNYLKCFSKEILNVLKYQKNAYVIYHVPRMYEKEVTQAKMGQWMIFLLKADGPSTIVPQGIGFASAARGSAMYESQEVVGDIVLLKIALPTGVIALKGKVDTGADISSLHVDSTPKIVGDTVRFENHNASGNIITAPLIGKQAVKSADGGVEYRPIIELDVEVNGKKISKAQFNLNNRSKMDHEILIGQNILEKGGFLVDPSENENTMESDESDINLLTEDELDQLLSQIAYLIENN